MRVPWAKPFINEEVVSEVIETTRSGWLSMGKRVKTLEDVLSELVGREYAIVVSSGTVALDIGLDLLDIKPGDEVIVPAITYVATATAVIRRGAHIVFGDIDPITYNLDPNDLVRKVSSRTKCIIPIDYGGNPANHNAILEVANDFNVPILLDGAQSLAGQYCGQPLCSRGTISISSLHAAKLLTAIEGGVIFTDNKKLANRAKILRNQGEDTRKKYIHVSLGYNARLTDLQAAIALAQLKSWDEILKKRKAIADFYTQSLKNTPYVVLPKTDCSCGIQSKNGECCQNGWFLFPILIQERDKIAFELSEAGIETRVCYPKPIYKQPFYYQYKRMGDGSNTCPFSDWFSKHVLNLPMFHEITNEDMMYVTTVLTNSTSKKAIDHPRKSIKDEHSKVEEKIAAR
jgi:dTDP-4-amino-4,6-dideoxygalactose transaminase